jgi:hypothetical protein
MSPIWSSCTRRNGSRACLRIADICRMAFPPEARPCPSRTDRLPLGSHHHHRGHRRGRSARTRSTRPTAASLAGLRRHFGGRGFPDEHAVERLFRRPLFRTAGNHRNVGRAERVRIEEQHRTCPEPKSRRSPFWQTPNSPPSRSAFAATETRSFRSRSCWAAALVPCAVAPVVLLSEPAAGTEPAIPVTLVTCPTRAAASRASIVDAYPPVGVPASRANPMHCAAGAKFVGAATPDRAHCQRHMTTARPAPAETVPMSQCSNRRWRRSDH